MGKVFGLVLLAAVVLGGAAYLVFNLDAPAHAPAGLGALNKSPADTGVVEKESQQRQPPSSTADPVASPDLLNEIMNPGFDAPGRAAADALRTPTGPGRLSGVATPTNPGDHTGSTNTDAPEGTIGNVPTEKHDGGGANPDNPSDAEGSVPGADGTAKGGSPAKVIPTPTPSSPDATTQSGSNQPSPTPTGTATAPVQPSGAPSGGSRTGGSVDPARLVEVERVVIPGTPTPPRPEPVQPGPEPQPAPPPPEGAQPAAGSPQPGAVSAPAAQTTKLTYTVAPRTTLTYAKDVTVDVTITGPATNEPAAVEFKLVFPDECMTYKSVSLVGFPGQKSPAANVPSNTPNTVIVTAFGLDQETIPSGAIIRLTFSVYKDMGAAWTGAISLSDQVGSTPDANTIQAEARGGVVVFK